MRTKTAAVLSLAAAAGIGLAFTSVDAHPDEREHKHAEPDGARAPGGADQDMMSADPSAIMEMMKQASQPTAQHQILRDMAGEYEMTAKFWMDPAGEPEVSKGTCTAEMTLGGRFLVCEIDMTFGFAGESMPLQGMGVIGFNRQTGEYQSVWMDTMSTAQTVQTGTMQDGSMVLTGTTTSPFGESKLKNIYTMRENGYDLEFWEPNPMNGEMVRTGIIEYRKNRG